MKRTVEIVADDRRIRIAVQCRIDTRGELARYEVATLERSLIRAIVTALPVVQFTDFGADNIRVKL